MRNEIQCFFHGGSANTLIRTRVLWDKSLLKMCFCRPKWAPASDAPPLFGDTMPDRAAMPFRTRPGGQDRSGRHGNGIHGAV
jgi:hypothetical protein